MDTNGYALSALLLLFFQLVLSLQADDSDVWSCPFDTDFCDWTVDESESPIASESLTEQKWRIFSPQDGDELWPPLQNPQSSKFVYLQNSHEVRSELKSPGRNVQVLKDKSSAVLLSFSFFSLNRATLALFLMTRKTHILDWSSTPKETFTQSEDNSTSLEEAWIQVAKCIPLAAVANDLGEQHEVRVAFVAHVVSNSTIGLRDVKALVLESGCAPDPAIEDETQGEKMSDTAITEDGVHIAWRFLVILSLFLCFGALFLATLVIVFGGGRSKFTGRKENRPSERESRSEFNNPAFQFQYQRLEST